MASSDYTTLRKIKHIQHTMEIDENLNETPSKWFGVNSSCETQEESPDINIEVNLPPTVQKLSYIKPKCPKIGEMYFDNSYIYIWTGVWKKTPIS